MKAGMAVLALAGALACASATAADSKLLRSCQAVLDYAESNGKRGSPYDVGYCSGVIETVTSLVEITNKAMEPDVRMCLPKEGTSVVKMANIVVGWLRLNSQYADEDDGPITMIALTSVYRCKQ